MNELQEKKIRLAGKMYEAREMARLLAGPRYKEHVEQWCGLLRRFMDDLNCGPMHVLPWLARRSKSDGAPMTGTQLMWITAATVEVIEGGATGNVEPDSAPNAHQTTQ